MNKSFVETFNAMQQSVHSIAREKGWWSLREDMQRTCEDKEQRTAGQLLGEFAERSNQITCLALVVSELAEAIEAIRNGNPPDDKIPTFSGAEAECADAIIRIMDCAEKYGWDVAGALVKKAEMNQGRPIMHGKKI